MVGAAGGAGGAFAFLLAIVGIYMRYRRKKVNEAKRKVMSEGEDYEDDTAFDEEEEEEGGYALWNNYWIYVFKAKDALRRSAKVLFFLFEGMTVDFIHFYTVATYLVYVHICEQNTFQVLTEHFFFTLHILSHYSFYRFILKFDTIFACQYSPGTSPSRS